MRAQKFVMHVALLTSPNWWQNISNLANCGLSICFSVAHVSLISSTHPRLEFTFFCFTTIYYYHHFLPFLQKFIPSVFLFFFAQKRVSRLNHQRFFRQTRIRRLQTLVLSTHHYFHIISHELCNRWHGRFCDNSDAFVRHFLSDKPHALYLWPVWCLFHYLSSSNSLFVRGYFLAYRLRLSLRLLSSCSESLSSENNSEVFLSLVVVVIVSRSPPSSSPKGSQCLIPRFVVQGVSRYHRSFRASFLSHSFSMHAFTELRES